VIDRRECCGRRLTGQRLTGAHALKWLTPPRSQAITTFSYRDPAVHRPFGLFAAASDLLVPRERLIHGRFEANDQLPERFARAQV
jgi:hypothetical protein